MMHEIISKISNLSLEKTEEEICESLRELKSALIQNPEISKSILNSNAFLKSFENYANDSEENALIICDIVEISLSNLTLQDPQSFLVIEHLLKTKCFTRIAIRKLQKDCQEIIQCVPKSTVLLLVSDCLKSEQVQVGPPSIELLVSLISVDLLDDADIKRELESCADSRTSEVKCRAYDVAVGLATKNFSYFEKIHFIIEKIIAELFKSEADLLLQMNLLEILQVLATKDYGLSYLEEKGVLQNLARKIGSVNEDPLLKLLIPSLMKFFGQIAISNPQKIYNNYSPLIDLLFECLLNDDHSSLTYAALDTLGNLCKYDDGKRSMDLAFGERVCLVLSKIYQSISNYPSEIKNRAFECLENVFYADENEEMMNNQIAYIAQKWINAIFNVSSFNTLLNFCNTPFEDLSLCAFGFLKSLVRHRLGQMKVAETGGFIEFLLDRKIGSTFEVKQKRYEIVEILASSNNFTATQIALLSKYVREGPNYVEPMSQVEFEPS